MSKRAQLGEKNLRELEEDPAAFIPGMRNNSFVRLAITMLDKLSDENPSLVRLEEACLSQMNKMNDTELHKNLLYELSFWEEDWHIKLSKCCRWAWTKNASYYREEEEDGAKNGTE